MFHQRGFVWIFGVPCTRALLAQTTIHPRRSPQCQRRALCIDIAPAHKRGTIPLAHRQAGPGPKNGQIIALTYAFNETRSVRRDQDMGTREAIERWGWHNYIRTAVLVAGVVVGAFGVAIDGR